MVPAMATVISNRSVCSSHSGISDNNCQLMWRPILSARACLAPGGMIHSGRPSGLVACCGAPPIAGPTDCSPIGGPPLISWPGLAPPIGGPCGGNAPGPTDPGPPGGGPCRGPAMPPGAPPAPGIPGVPGGGCPPADIGDGGTSSGTPRSSPITVPFTTFRPCTMLGYARALNCSAAMVISGKHIFEASGHGYVFGSTTW